MTTLWKMRTPQKKKKSFSMEALRLLDDMVLAIASNSTDIVTEILCDPSFAVDSPDSRGHTPLIYACAYGRLEIVRALVERRADISYKIPATRTSPLHVAASNGFAEVVEFLLAEGADGSVRDFSGLTALEYAEIQPEASGHHQCSITRNEAADDRLHELRKSCIRTFDARI